MRGANYFNSLQARANEVHAKVRSGEGILPHELVILHELATVSQRVSDQVNYVNAKSLVVSEKATNVDKSENNDNGGKVELETESTPTKSEADIVAERMQASSDQDRAAALSTARSKMEQALEKARRTSNVSDQLAYLNAKSEYEAVEARQGE